MVQLAHHCVVVAFHVFHRLGHILKVPELRPHQVSTFVNLGLVKITGFLIFFVMWVCVYRSGRISSGDQLMPLFVLDTMGQIRGLTGLFLAGVCSSAMCAVSAALNSLAAVTLEDYIIVKLQITLLGINTV